MGTNSEKLWQEKFYEWYTNSGMSKKDIERASGVPGPTLKKYLSGKTHLGINHIKPENREALYKLTQLECFRIEGEQEDKIHIGEPRKRLIVEEKEEPYEDRIKIGKEISEHIKEARASVDSIVEDIIPHLTATEALKSGLLKTQLYNVSAEKRACSVMELLHYLAAEVNYFRTASINEKKVLAEILSKNPDNFRFSYQMLNAFCDPSRINNWELTAQPPDFIKNIGQGDKESYLKSIGKTRKEEK